MNNRPIKSPIGRIFLAFATAAVVLTAILFAAVPPRAALGQNGERPSSSVQTLADPVPKEKAPAPLVPTASWSAAAPIPGTSNNSSYAFAQDGENFYLISGSSSVNTVRRYNATTNVWTSLANIPQGATGSVATYYQGQIYFANGTSAGFQTYNVATDTWDVGPNRPGIANSFGAAAGAYTGPLFGKVYIAGGGPASNGSTTLSIYNVGNATWAAGPSLPFAYKDGGFTQVGQYLYLIGSRTTTSTHSNISMRLDMATDTWSTGPAFTPRRAVFALAAAGTRLFAIGGESNGGTTQDSSALVNELDTLTWPAGAWIASPDNLPSPRQDNNAGFFSTSRAGGEIWSTGGTFPNITNVINEHLFRPVAIPCLDYNITESRRSLIPAGTDIGNHCDNCLTPITFPFPITFYGATYTTANASSDGNLQFNSAQAFSNGTNLPIPDFGPTIFAFHDGLSTFSAGRGIFTSVSGTAPNRFFTIEWRVGFGVVGQSATFEIRFQENSPDFEIIYGTSAGNPGSGIIGVQRGDADRFFTQFAGPNADFPARGTRLVVTTGCCAPIAFNGSIGEGSDTYPGSSGFQIGRVAQNGIRSVCGSQKNYPGTIGDTSRTSDLYRFPNYGPATCVTFSVHTACSGNQLILPVAYLGSFTSASIATNYVGDPGGSPLSFETFSVNVPANATVLLVVSEVNLQGNCGSYDVVVRGLNCPLELTGAASRKTHGAAGEFDIPLPLTGQPGVECRTGGAGGNHKLVFTFDSQSELTSGAASVTAGAGSAGPSTFLGATMTVPVSGVTDLQKITVTLIGVRNSLGHGRPDAVVSMNVLLGDTTGSKAVNASDIGQTKSRSGQAASVANFRSDTTVSGSINASDIGQVKANSGHAVP